MLVMFGVTIVYLGVGIALELWAPKCFDMDRCLQNGVDDSTSTIIVGFLTSLWMLGLAIHLWTVRCSSASHHPGNDTQANIRSSGIWGQVHMALAILWTTLARTLQPNANVGQRVFWSFNATAVFFLALSIYCFGHFAMRTIRKRLQVLCCSCCDRTDLITGLVIKSAIVVFGAGVACAVFESTTTEMSQERDDSYNNATVTGLENVTDDQLISMSLHSNVNIFDHNQARLLQLDESEIDIPELQIERMAQSIFFWGSIALSLACFLFWNRISKIIRKAIRRREQKLKTLDGQYLEACGMRSMTSAHLLPWVSFTIGHLLPVWVVLIATWTHTYWLDVWIMLRAGILYHYGLALMALFVHNWTLTLTRNGPDPPPPPFKFNEVLFHDLTLGVFERSENEKRNNAVFHDLTFGIFEPFDTLKKKSVPNKRVDLQEMDLENYSEELCDDEATISRVDHHSFGQTRIYQGKSSTRY